MKKGFSFISIIFYCFLCKSQDIHFSQFQHSPTNLSPSLVGMFDGNYRFIFNQKSQWRAVTAPFVTYSISADAKDLFYKNCSSGIIILNDRAGDSEFNTFQANINSSYYIPLTNSENKNNGISIGLLAGYTQKQLNYNKLQFDNQFNGIQFDPSIGNGENFDTNKKQYLNLNTGISYHEKLSENNSYLAGISINNLSNPNENIVSNNNKAELSKRINLFGYGDFLIAPKISALPAFLFSSQGPNHEFLIGSNARFKIEDKNNRNITAKGGFFYRYGDATFVVLGLDINKLSMGLSYDINHSSLKNASGYQGGFEFSVIYIIDNYIPKMIFKRPCPVFI